MNVIIYADGACKGNPGRGGWGAYLSIDGVAKDLCGGEVVTTNNRMELTAVIEALKVTPTEASVICYVDSQYVKNGIEKWIAGWKRNNWVASTGKPVKNIDLWKLLDEQVKAHKVEWRWVKGHSGDPGNERADFLANKGVPRG